MQLYIEEGIMQVRLMEDSMMPIIAPGERTHSIHDSTLFKTCIHLHGSTLHSCLSMNVAINFWNEKEMSWIGSSKLIT